MRGPVPGLSWNRATKRGEVVVWLAGSGGRRRKHRFRASNEVQARAIARTFLEQVRREELLDELAPVPAPGPVPTLSPAPPPEKGLTLAGLFASHLERFLERKRQSTAEFYRAVKKVVGRDGVLAERELRSFRKPDIEDFMLRLEKQGRASTTAAGYGAALVCLLRWAVDRDLLDEFPIKKRIVYPTRQKPELELSPEEERQLLAAFDEAYFRERLAADDTLRGFRSKPETFGRLQAFFPLLLAGMRTGLRKGDLLRLTWGHVNLAEGWIELVTAKKGVPVAVGVAPDLAAVLTRIRPESPAPEDLVFLRQDGEPWTEQSVKDVYVLAKRVAGIKRRLRFHDATRHTLGSTLVTGGMTLEEVAAVLGHRDYRSTQRYARVRSRAVRHKFLAALARHEAEASAPPSDAVVSICTPTSPAQTLG